MKSYRTFFWLLAATGLLLDQTSKYGVFGYLYNEGNGGEISVIDGFFKIEARYTHHTWAEEEGSAPMTWLRTLSGQHMPAVNHGALFGLGAGNNWLFSVVSVAAALLIAFISRRPNIARDGFLCFALGLILAGTLGNLFDRTVFGGVRDFLHFFLLDADGKIAWNRWADWPVFNIADCCLVVGAGTLLIHAFFTPEPGAQPAPQAAVADAEAVAPQL